ncbi:hypothetical protein QYF61_022935 [Mycteria americana]|uniref:Uncharacterized protein n=1 Tax=Mycteria americana TaxID=33587 RepID=A0AAN7RH70_MYCAM|nr:hypothetical protein QYF61_022935 [Mycteria americana]
MLLNGRFAVVATVLVLQWRASAPFTKRIYSYQDTFGVSSCHWQRSFEVNLQSCPWAFNTLVLDWAFYSSVMCVGHGVRRTVLTPAVYILLHRTSICSSVGSSTGCRRDICSTVDIHGLQGDSLLHHGLHHGLQENLCSAAWSTSSPSFFSDLITEQEIKKDEIPPEHEETLAECEGGHALDAVAQRGCALSIRGDTQNPTGNDHQHPAAADPSLSRLFGLDDLQSDSTLGNLFFCGAPVTARPRHMLSMEISRALKELQTPLLKDIICMSCMRGFNVGGTTEYRTAITRSREGEAMEGGFSIEKTTAPGSCCHVGTSSAAQERPIVQGFADGNVAVIGHDGEKRNLCCNQEGKQKHLGSASCIGNSPGVPEGIGHGFGDSGRDGAQVMEGEVEEEEVHGGVEAAVTGYGGDDEAVAQEGSQVDAQEEPEVQELQLPCVREWQEEELGDGAAVGHLLPQGMGTCPKRKAH